MRALYANADHAGFSRNDIVLSLVVAMGLAIPFVPTPWDGEARMDVEFLADGMVEPHAFSASTSRSNCSIMATSLAYEDRETGKFTHITCAR